MINKNTNTGFVLLLVFIGVMIAKEPNFEFKYSKKEANLYRMSIKPITPEDGIRTGHVIAYGHYLKPPYIVDILIVESDTGIYINNVKIDPPLCPVGLKPEIETGQQMSWDSVNHSIENKYIGAWQQYGVNMSLLTVDSLWLDYYNKINKQCNCVRRLTNDVVIKSMYWFYRKNYDINNSFNLLAAFIRDSLKYYNVQISSVGNAKGISYEWDDPQLKRVPWVMGFEIYTNHTDSLMPSNNQNNRMENVFKKRAENYRDFLNKNGTLFIGYKVIKQNPGSLTFETYLKIMKSNTGVEEKARLLSEELHFLPDGVKEIIYNYNKKELK